jgi:hypothetical protein
MITEEEIRKIHVRLIELTDPAQFDAHVGSASDVAQTIKSVLLGAGVDPRVILLACVMLVAEGIAGRAKNLDDAAVGLRAWELGVEHAVKTIVSERKPA